MKGGSDKKEEKKKKKTTTTKSTKTEKVAAQSEAWELAWEAEVQKSENSRSTAPPKSNREKSKANDKVKAENDRLYYEGFAYRKDGSKFITL